LDIIVNSQAQDGPIDTESNSRAVVSELHLTVGAPVGSMVGACTSKRQARNQDIPSSCERTYDALRIFAWLEEEEGLTLVGDFEGMGVIWIVGLALGTALGSNDGTWVGSVLGRLVGIDVGGCVGAWVGPSVGAWVGRRLGTAVGKAVGSGDGAGLGPTDGARVGPLLGNAVGGTVGS
jgi:hypothetical protein